MGEIIQSEEVVKLYEYNQYKPELEEVIEHHQALGAHWGIYNGPPYPLSRVLSTGKRLKPAAKGVSSGGGSESDSSTSKKRQKAVKKAQKTRRRNLRIKTKEAKKQQQIEKTKDEIIKSKDIKSMLMNVDKFTNQEINSMLDRLNVEQRLREEVRKMENSKKTWGRKIKDNVGTAVKEEIPKTFSEMTKTATNRGIKLASNRVLKNLVGPNAETKYGDKWQDIIDNLIPDTMGKKKEKEK